MPMATPTVEFPSECGRVLLHEVLVSFGDTVRVEANIIVPFPLWVIPHCTAPVSQNATIDDGLPLS